VAASQIELDKSKTQLRRCPYKTCRILGQFSTDVRRTQWRYFKTKPHGTFEEFSAQAANNPDLARWKSELGHRKAMVALEKSKSVPDVTVSAGTKYLAGPDDTALSWVFQSLADIDRNQGNISGLARTA